MHQYTTPDYTALQAPYAPLLRAALAAATPGGARLALDLACGRGAYQPWLATVCAAGATLLGLDLDRDALAAAPAGGLWLAADAQHLPIRPGVADLAWCVAALSLFAAPRLALAEARRALRPGGTLVVTVAGERWVRLRRWPSTQVPTLECPASPSDVVHVRPPADGLGDELRATLLAVGFRTCDLAAYLLEPPGLARHAAQLPLADLAPAVPLAIAEPAPLPVLFVATAYA